MYSHNSRLEASNFGFKKKRKCSIRVAKTKALMICVFVFAYADCWFSHEAAQMSRFMRNRVFACAKTKAQMGFAVTAKLISAFVFASRIVHFLFFFKSKISSLWPSSVLVYTSRFVSDQV